MENPFGQSYKNCHHPQQTLSSHHLSVSNPYILSFYNENQNINFEEANLLIINILKICNDFKINSLYKHETIENKENMHNQTQLEKDEDNLEVILNKINPTSNIMRNNKTDYFYDFMLMRENKQKIIVESKEININVKNEQVDLFVDTCKQLKAHGIFISQKSGIINKYNYQIDIFGTNIIVYIHCANFDHDKIKIAFDIIDSVHDKIHYMNMSNSDYSISKDLLTEINQEYQFFVKQKDELKNFIKDKEHKLLNQLDDVRMSKLNNYLSGKFLSNENTGIHKCNLCNFYTSNTLKGMAAHKRGCKKKHAIST